MKKFITLSNMTDAMREYLKENEIPVATFQEAVRSRKRNQTFVIEGAPITEPMDTVEVFNIDVKDREYIDTYDFTVADDWASKIIELANAIDKVPYCEIPAYLIFGKIEEESDCAGIADCEDCFIDCKFRKSKAERKEKIDKIFNCYCKEIYETHGNDFKKLRIAFAMNWEIDGNYDAFREYVSEEQLFDEFIYGDFNSFKLMREIIKKRCPELLDFYEKNRRKKLSEIFKKLL